MKNLSVTRANMKRSMEVFFFLIFFLYTLHDQLLAFPLNTRPSTLKQYETLNTSVFQLIFYFSHRYVVDAARRTEATIVINYAVLSVKLHFDKRLKSVSIQAI